VAGSVARVKKINTAQAELQQLETALENYKAKYGVYPPSNGTNGVVNQLYYELSGVIKTNGTFLTLDGNTSLSTGAFGNQFYGAGVLNCSQGGGEEGVTAKNFLPGLKANEIAYATNGTGSYATIPYYYLVTSVGGPDVGYHPPLIYNPPLTGNPFRYVSPGLHNPNSYDLWVQLSINSTPVSPHLYLVCNWSQQVARNSPMP
jgi:type II secretory pathway pseudopilin PulG